MGKIKKLESHVANMIAAGEVVERPMGVIKELIENSIDAHATKIVVSIEEGGVSKLSVLDNGDGMSSIDAEMSLERHATSKISKEEDLWTIHTLGFRGEALPSIASVSKLTLTTSDGDEGTRIVVEYGAKKSAEVYPCNKGTEVVVEGLFYQTPARLKHMKTASYEASLIQNVISSFALSHPEIAFELISDGREAFKTTGQGKLLEVIYQVGGKAVAENAIPVEFEDYDYKVTGYLIKPSITRASRSMMHIFLNGRMVRTLRLYRAIQDGYEDFIVKGRYPLCVLNIEMDSHLLDVNVHPSKWEVRISKENQLEYLIKDGVSKALKSSNLSPEKEIKEAREYVFEPISFDIDKLIQDSAVKYDEKKEVVATEKEIEKPTIDEYIQEETSVINAFPSMTVIGQLHDKYILCAVDEGLVIVDQHAAQERVNYEMYKEKLNKKPVMVETLVPITIHTSSDVVNRLEELNEAINDLNITFEAFGSDTLVVHNIPAWLQDVEETAFLEDVVQAFKDDNEIKYTKMEKKKIATMACHHSIRFNKTLTMDEMQEVIRQLSLCDNPYHCPHGRPTFITLKEKELVKEFLR